MSLTSADLLQQKKLNLHEGEKESVLIPAFILSTLCILIDSYFWFDTINLG